MNAALGPQCYTCRRRQVRCDSNSPQCHRCQRDGRDCLGYRRPLKVIAYEPGERTQSRKSTSPRAGLVTGDARAKAGSENETQLPQRTAGLTNGHPSDSPRTACKACRRVSPKSDVSQQRCSRCFKVMSGQRQFEFLNHSSRGEDARTTRQRNISSKTTCDNFSTPTFFRSPSTASCPIQGSLVKAIDPVTDVRFNLAWTYGEFFELLPQRIGISPVLDTALEALLSAHSDVCLGYRSVQTRTLFLHLRALRNLRSCLDDQRTAHTTETLAAILLLLTLQGIVGSNGDYWSQHYVGASQILKARHVRSDHDDAFEGRLLEALRGLVLIEGILSGRLDFTTEEWRRLMIEELREGTPSEVVMHCISNIPDLLRRRRWRRDGDEASQKLYAETIRHYSRLKEIANRYRLALKHQGLGSPAKASESSGRTSPDPAVLRVYAICLFFAVTLNLLVRSFQNPENDLLLEGEHLAREIVVVAKETLPYRPFGASHMVMCLMAGHAATRDPEVMEDIVRAHENYAEDFPWAVNPSSENGMHSFGEALRLPGLETSQS